MYNSQEVSSVIKRIAKEKKISIGKLCSDCGISKNTLSTMQSGGYLPRIETICKIADYLNVSIDYLLGRTIEPNYNVSYNFGNHNMALGDLNITNNGDNQKMNNFDKVSLELLRIFQNLDFNDKAKVINLINELDQK